MKKLLILSSTLLTLLSNGQTSVYKPFPTNYGNWIYQYYDDFHNPTNQFTQYTLNGDTTFASISYKKIFVYSNYVGALRENNKIIYFVPDTSSNEYVLYNFNLNLGDTIIHPYGEAVCSNDTAIIQQVDSILLSDGYHRQLHFNSFAIWIEGIGSLNYLLNPCNVACLSGNDILQCMNSDLTFTYPSISTSCIVSVPEQISSSNNINIYPNPSSSSFSIDFNNTDFKEIRLTDMLGKIVFRQQTDNHLKINVENLHSGTYILTIIDKDNNSTNRKIISCP